VLHWVLLPIHNEASTIGPLIDQIKPHGSRILVVDDGSTDMGSRIARNRGATVLRSKKNLGKGNAVRKGFSYLLRTEAWETVVVMDADGQHDPNEIPKFLKEQKEGNADIVVGNRMQARGDMPPLRWMTNRFMSFIISLLMGQRIPDSQCGFRCLSRRCLRALRLRSERFELESEMLIQAGRKRFKIVSVPIRTIYRNQISRIDPIADTFRFLRLLFRRRTALPEV
jgi:glycosyltransferase involved in cell wall biosynthesis